MSHPLAVWLEHLRSAFAKETLPPPPDEVPGTRRRPSLGRLLFAIEPLPFEPERVARKDRPGLLTLLFAPERLPQDPAPPPRRGQTRWLAWLFLPERLDRDVDSHEVD
jgi:hypothetical protein